MSIWSKFERCSHLMAEYKERFGTNVPRHIMFYPMEEISDIVDEALRNNEEIRSED